MSNLSNTFRNNSRTTSVPRSTVTQSPRNIKQDLAKTIRELDPVGTPFLTLMNYIGKGERPMNMKVEVAQYHKFDPFDEVTAVTMGLSGDSELRFARITPAQLSRPEINSIFYQTQDKLYIKETGQMVEVVMTPTASYHLGNNNFISLSTNVTGNTTTRSQEGTIVVRNIEQAPLKTIPLAATLTYTSRTIYESQKIEALPTQTDYIYDYNFVEHKEAVIQFTEDQYRYMQTEQGGPDFNLQQRDAISRLKQGVEYACLMGERAINFDVPGRPTRHMRGFLNAVKTNKAYYNPATTQDYEELVINFLYEQAYRYQGTGQSMRDKVGLCGGKFGIDFAKAFKDYRRTSDLNPGKIGKETGLDIDTYSFQGRKLLMQETQLLRQNTDYENWLMVLAPEYSKLRTLKDFDSRFYELDDERDVKFMIEWKGTVCWELEHMHALLRT